MKIATLLFALLLLACVSCVSIFDSKCTEDDEIDCADDIRKGNCVVTQPSHPARRLLLAATPRPTSSASSTSRCSRASAGHASASSLRSTRSRSRGADLHSQMWIYICWEGGWGERGERANYQYCRETIEGQAKLGLGNFKAYRC